MSSLVMWHIWFVCMGFRMNLDGPFGELCALCVVGSGVPCVREDYVSNALVVFARDQET